jgi:hypothetical protein
MGIKYYQENDDSRRQKDYCWQVHLPESTICKLRMGTQLTQHLRDFIVYRDIIFLFISSMWPWGRLNL